MLTCACGNTYGLPPMRGTQLFLLHVALLHEQRAVIEGWRSIGGKRFACSDDCAAQQAINVNPGEVAYVVYYEETAAFTLEMIGKGWTIYGGGRQQGKTAG